MLRAAAARFRCTRLDAPDECLEDLLATYDRLVLHVDTEAWIAPAPLDAVTFAIAALWLRACWTSEEIRHADWPAFFGADFGWWS